MMICRICLKRNLKRKNNKILLDTKFLPLCYRNFTRSDETGKTSTKRQFEYFLRNVAFRQAQDRLRKKCIENLIKTKNEPKKTLFSLLFLRSEEHTSELQSRPHL